MPRDDGDGQQHAVKIPSPAREFQYGHTHMPQVLDSLDDQLDRALVEQSRSTHGSVHIALQFDPALLPDTNATLHISLADLLVRFETRHPAVADLLSTHANSLAERLARRTSRNARVEIAE
jgi:hypothetical protein